MHERLFTYGTLQFPAMMRAVLGRTLPLQTAELTGFRRHQVRRRVFPAIVPDAQGVVPGRLIEGVDPWTLARIDDYEGPPFHRHRVTVSLPDQGDTVEAIAYVLRPRYHCLLLNEDWDAERFRRHWQAWYVREYESVYGTGDK